MTLSAIKSIFKFRYGTGIHSEAHAKIYTLPRYEIPCPGKKSKVGNQATMEIAFPVAAVTIIVP